jgi:uncharacterized protein YyaL (SSP411 family)
MSGHKHTNRLSGESSPYLLQHAHNPVEWYPWGPEALARSRDENKPILLSIGYSACHWCHVMERESFEDERIAALMNERFVNIKVDREERPDLDQIYMNAVQLMTRHGGWPLTVFLTPELVPFYGGTYFPPEDRHGMPGFPRVLAGVSEAFSTRPEEIAESAREILAELGRMNPARESGLAVSKDLLDQSFSSIARGYDERNGGFGGAPKFPAAMNLEFLLRTHKRTRDPKALEMVANTCRKMAEGGLYDHLGGGFHRYSTDAHWLVPHFEKMLYDNALLSRLYLHAYQTTGEDFYRRVAEETLDYVVREMTDEGGGFYSTQDADSEGVEGKFFVWEKGEVERLLGPDDAALFCAYYNVTEGGNFEEKNILNVTRTAHAVATGLKVSPERLEEALARGRRLLFEARESRVKPGRDEKILTAWNGLMLESFAEAAAVLGRADYRAVAERNAEFVLGTLKRDVLLHFYKDGQAKHVGFLDDYAFYASGLVTLYETTGTARWLREAVALTEKMLAEFWDEADGGLFYTGESGEQLIVRSKDFFDNATPSGNSVAAEVLLRLSVLTGNEAYRRKAVNVIRLVHESVARYPSAFGYTLGAIDFYFSTPKEIVVVSPRGAEAEAEKLAGEIWGRYLPNKVVVQAVEGFEEETVELVPLLRERRAEGGKPTAYVCENYSCRLPVSTPERLAAQLDEGLSEGASSV